MADISVIIPAYNRGALIGPTLDSVRAQSYPDYELIVVDDGSTDDTIDRILAAARSDQNAPPLVLLTIPHSGAGAARNAGLGQATGQYIAFLDSDDVWDPCFLEEMHAKLGRHPDAGFVYCDYGTFDQEGIKRRRNLFPEQKIAGNLFAALLEEDFLCTGALLFRRECFDRAGLFDSTLSVSEDWDMWLRIAQSMSAICLDEPLVRIRLDSGHASRNPEVIYTLNLRVLAKIRRLFPESHRRARPRIRRQQMRFHRALADYYRSNGQWRRAARHLGECAGAVLFS